MINKLATIPIVKLSHVSMLCQATTPDEWKHLRAYMATLEPDEAAAAQFIFTGLNRAKNVPWLGLTLCGF